MCERPSGGRFQRKRQTLGSSSCKSQTPALASILHFLFKALLFPITVECPPIADPQFLARFRIDQVAPLGNRTAERHSGSGNVCARSQRADSRSNGFQKTEPIRACSFEPLCPGRFVWTSRDNALDDDAVLRLNTLSGRCCEIAGVRTLLYDHESLDRSNRRDELA